MPTSRRPHILQEDSIAGQGVNSDGPPSLEANEQFPVIIGSDLIYEVPDLHLPLCNTCSQLHTHHLIG